MMDRRPICPGCETLARPKDCEGEIRWCCDTPGCSCHSFLDNWNPNPRIGQSPTASRRPASEPMPLFAGRRS